MKVVELPKGEVEITEIRVADCFKLGSSILMVINNHAHEGSIAAVNLQSGQTTTLGCRTKVVPFKAQIVEME